MKLSEILAAKGDRVHTTAPHALLTDVVDDLVRHNVGSLVVVTGNQVLGIITERDILRACASHQGDLSGLSVQDHMSSPVTSASPDDELGEAMGILTSRRIRHLPVLQESELVGMISIGDVVKAQHDQLSFENQYLKNYIHS